MQHEQGYSLVSLHRKVGVVTEQADLSIKLFGQVGSLACLCRLAELLARPSARVMLVHAVSQVLRPCFLVRKSPKLPQLQAEL